MEEDISNKSLTDIIKEMTLLEQDIGLKQIKHNREIALMELKYERLRLEVIKRFPQLENNEEFKPRQKKL